MSRCVVCFQPLLKNKGRGRPRIVCEKKKCINEQIYQRNNSYRDVGDLLARAEVAREQLARAQRKLERTLSALAQRGVTT